MGPTPMGWWLGLAPATLEFWVRFPNERNQGKQAHPVLKYRVPHGSQPRPGWAPDPLMVGIRSPDGLVVGLAPATLEFWVRFPNERNQGKQAHPVLKYRVPHGSQPRPGWAPDPLMVGIRSPDGLVVGLAPATLEFWVRFPNERNQGKQAHPVLKYRVPHGSQCRCSRMRARLPLPRVLLPHTCTQDGWFLQPKRRPARLPRRTVPSNCICRCSRMRARLPLPRVLLPHTCTQDGWFLQPKRRPARLPRRTVPSNCICRCSRMRARLPLHILLLHTQVSR
jgi:hypothetical protein